MSGGFQSQVNVQPAPAVAGDFCDSNPRFTVDAGAGALVAGPAGVAVGRFCWNYAPDDPNGFPGVINNFGTGLVLGFVARAQQGLITQYLADASMVVPQGFAMTAFNGGGFWVVNSGGAQALPGMKAYANYTNGLATFAATGNPNAGATATAWTIAAETTTFTGSINGGILTASAVTGVIYPGSILSGGTVATGTAIGQQITGAVAGGAGTYYVSIPEQTVASAALTAAYGLLTLTTVSAGAFAVNDTLTGATSGVTAGTTITQFITGAGGSGSTAAVNFSQTSGNSGQGNLTAASNIETKWYCMSSGLPGELVKIQSHPLG
jgi:hypothetical protein